MGSNLNALRWDGRPGHYEVYYLSLTDRGGGWGIWIRYTMVAPTDAGQATASLWLMSMPPAGEGPALGRKATRPADALSATAAPFSLRIGDAVLSERGAEGAFEDVAWSLSWEPDGRPAEHVHPLLQAARVAKTVLVLPQPDLAVSGTVRIGGRTLVLERARGGQAHIWGSKHASRWAWVHCNDLETVDGRPRAGDYLDGVSVFVPRFGRELGPNTPVVGRIGGQEFRSTNPVRVNGNASRFALTGWDLEARAGARKLLVDVDAPRATLVGVTYHDPDGERAYCYNSEVASLRCRVHERDRSSPTGWRQVETLLAPGRAHFEYAQREPVHGVALAVT
ncbi:MAG TPA: hypothetical protein VHR88_10980 [Solirubrobacteraceae bacterium]|jgi:hypothetical protein|nr:hypothetical protein [Solirubrobacteraceae bacterium]